MRLQFWALVLHVRESIENVGMGDSFGIVQFSGGSREESLEKSGSTVRPTVRELEAWRWESVCFSFS